MILIFTVKLNQADLQNVDIIDILNFAYQESDRRCLAFIICQHHNLLLRNTINYLTITYYYIYILLNILLNKLRIT